MELSLDQTLQKGVEAHRAGKVQEADKYYNVILKANPKHPDANHNMGVLAVGVGKVEEALPFFKNALDANPNIDQFWLSYIDALIKLDRIDDAKEIFYQAKNIGAQGDGFDQLEKRLGSPSSNISQSKEPHPEELQSLVKLYKQNELQQAFKDAQNLAKVYSKSAILWNLIGAMAAQLGRLDEAIIACKKAISLKPNSAETYNNMGIALKEKGELEQAIETYKKAISLKPDYAEAYNNMGNALREQCKLKEALQAINIALSINPYYTEAYNNMGIVLKDKGRSKQAIEAYTKAISIKSDYADAYYNLGNVLNDQGRLEEAIEAYKKAIFINSDYADAFNNMGVALKDQGRLEEAIEAYTKAIFIKPNYAEAYNNIGTVLKDQGRLEEAIEASIKALTIKPDYAEAHNNMGVALQEQGKTKETIEAYNLAIALKPDYAEAHRNLSTIKKYKEDDDQLIQVQQLYKEEDLSEDAKCNLSFALHRMYEDIGDLNKAFSHLSKGNALRKKLLKYSINQDKELFTKLKRTQPYLQKVFPTIEKNSTDPNLVFIIGMPRSGTTLVEQIISSHSLVTGAGELNYIEQFRFEFATEIAHINTLAVSEVRVRYLAELSKLSNGKPFITDKMPQNFRFLPLICAAFPEAKIIHVKRDASATCWSNYKQYFVSKDLGYCYDLRDIVAYYNLYTDMMKLWQSHYGDRIFHLNYETLTTDQENETRKLIKHLELNWEEACLSPHENKRSVRTASQQQVRQRVYKGSSEAWRKYEPFLIGAFDNLKSK